MKELLQKLIDKGFKAKTLTTKWTLTYFINYEKGKYLVTPLCELLLLEEIKAWFRNEHKKHVNIDCNHSGWYFEIFKINGTTIYISYDESYQPFQSYELALQAGIEEAIKLI